MVLLAFVTLLAGVQQNKSEYIVQMLLENDCYQVISAKLGKSLNLTWWVCYEVVGMGLQIIACIISEKMSQGGQPSGKMKIDLIVIGNPNSGKTSLIRRFIDGQTSFNQYYTPTLGLHLQKKLIKIEDQEINVCIWDTAGQEKFFSLTKNYFKKADGVLVVFDLTDKLSFEKVDKFWVPEIKEKSDQNCIQVLIGNKKDMLNERAVPTETAQQLAQGLDIKYFQTSAKTGDGVAEAIEYLVKDCLSRVKTEEQSGVQLKLPPEEKSSCSTALKDFFRGLRNRFS